MIARNLRTCHPRRPRGSRRFGSADKFVILPLHSMLSPAEQSAVFERPPPGARKVRSSFGGHLPNLAATFLIWQVILATNIAETSITIDDAVFVIDAGRAKQATFDERKQMRRLIEVWISQAPQQQQPNDISWIPQQQQHDDNNRRRRRSARAAPGAFGRATRSNCTRATARARASRPRACRRCSAGRCR